MPKKPYKNAKGPFYDGFADIERPSSETKP